MPDNMRRTRKDPESIREAVKMQQRDTLSETMPHMNGARERAGYLVLYRWAMDNWDAKKWHQSANWSVKTVLDVMRLDYARAKGWPRVAE